MSENHFNLVLDDLKQRSIDRLIAADVFDASAFEALREHLWRKAEGLKHKSVISKQVLLGIRSAAKALRSRAEYLPSASQQLVLAGEFEVLLDRLIAGETREDRQPGVPRII